MWMITPLGTFSIRCTAIDARKGTLTIETRVRSDLEALVTAVLPTASPIVETASRPRGYMVRVGRGEVALAMSTFVLDLHYDDLTEEFADHQGAVRSATTQSLWQAMHTQ
jgi:hypothetical protein